MRRFVAFLVCSAVIANAQQVGQNATPAAKDTVTFQATAQLVVETVVVKDKAGNSVEGLTAKDFAITEDGVAQEIRFFEFQKLKEVPGAPPADDRAAPRPQAFEKFPKTRIAAETPGNTRYRDRRLMALYFDMTAMQ